MSAFRVYATMDQRLPLSKVAAHARRAEAMGYDGLSVPDAAHDGLAVAALALDATTRLRVATGVLIAFPRSPMVVAVAAWDLQELSGGRFALGLGSQVRGNIVGRYSTEWTPPAPRMREYIDSLRAIFDCWQNDAELAFEGEHYRFTRMQPFFKPDPLDCGPPDVYLGGIGRHMVAVAGETSDGLLTHPTNASPRYLREVVLPRLAVGARRRGRSPGETPIMAVPLTVTGPDDETVERERTATRRLLGFLYSTPAYWPSLELHGWRERGERLRELTRQGKWTEMESLVDDEMLSAFAPTGRYDEIGDVLRTAYEGLSSWITFPMPADRRHDDAAAEVIARLQRS